MLSDSPIFTILPASDWDRARALYSKKLGLEPPRCSRTATSSTRRVGFAST